MFDRTSGQLHEGVQPAVDGAVAAAAQVGGGARSRECVLISFLEALEVVLQRDRHLLDQADLRVLQSIQVCSWYRAVVVSSVLRGQLLSTCRSA